MNNGRAYPWYSFSNVNENAHEISYAWSSYQIDGNSCHIQGMYRGKDVHQYGYVRAGLDWKTVVDREGEGEREKGHHEIVCEEGQQG